MPEQVIYLCFTEQHKYLSAFDDEKTAIQSWKFSYHRNKDGLPKLVKYEEVEPAIQDRFKDVGGGLRYFVFHPNAEDQFDFREIVGYILQGAVYTSVEHL